MLILLDDEPKYCIFHSLTKPHNFLKSIISSRPKFTFQIVNARLYSNLNTDGELEAGIQPS